MTELLAPGPATPGTNAPASSAPDSPAPANPAPYRVLARKYRPTSFAGLIGQDALVRTLSNAIASGRLAHAFILTGVRGVGKTTTARILARALNCVGPDGKGGPTVEPCGACEHCVAIAQDRHLDVMEMDAASRTGIDDIREIIDGVQYAPVSARYKVYIIDEVHMLSKAAFNGLLKTLEEPPAHVKFVFATTEIRKVPVTVLSRCQRFDLRRVPAELLARHFAQVAAQEGAALEPEALALIARAADGSVRDGLSILDQAIAHAGAAEVTAAQLREMLGVADRTRLFDLFEALLRGEAAQALAQFGDMHEAGADPVVVLQDLLELTHWLTRLKVNPEDAQDAALPEADRVRGRALADRLSMAVLTRAWQMLLKGLGEAQHAPAPRLAADMLFVRMAYAANLPTPAEIIGRFRAEGGAAAPPAQPARSDAMRPEPAPAGSATARAAAAPRAASDSLTPRAASDVPAPRAEAGALAIADPVPDIAPMPQAEAPQAAEPRPAEPPRPASFAEVVALFRERGELMLHAQLWSNVHLVGFRPGRMAIRPNEHAPPNLAGDVAGLLSRWCGERWVVTVAREPGEPTLAEQAAAREAELRRGAAAHPLVKAALAAFPGAVIEAVRELAPLGPEPPAPLSEEDGLDFSEDEDEA